MNGYNFFIPLGGFVQAWADNHADGIGSVAKDQSGSEMMKVLLEMTLNAGVGVGISYLIFQLAEELLEQGLSEQADEQLELGWQHVQTVGEHILEPKYHRLKGLVALASYRSRPNEYWR